MAASFSPMSPSFSRAARTRSSPAAKDAWQAASRAAFGKDASELTAAEAARLAAVLPDPKDRRADRPGPIVRRRAAQIAAGADTIAADGRASCFQD